MERKRTVNKAPAILTNDPSLLAWGWAVLKGDTILAQGCIKTEPNTNKTRIRKGDDRVRRLKEIANQLLEVICQYNVGYILSELPHGSQTASAAVMVGAVSGLLEGLSVALGVPCEWFSEADSKKAVLHRSSCTKEEMITAIGNLYDVVWYNVKYKDEAVADAIAIHYCAKKSSPTVQYLTNQ